MAGGLHHGWRTGAVDIPSSQRRDACGNGLVHQAPCVALPLALFGQHRHIAEARLLGRQMGEPGILVEVVAGAGAPKQRDRTADVGLDDLAQDGLERRIAGTAAEQQDRARAWAQRELAKRSLDPQQRALGHGFEHLRGELAAAGAAHVQLEQPAIMRRIRQREAAPAARREHDVDVLAGQPLERLDRGQAQPQAHDVRCEQAHALYPRRQALDLHVRDVLDLASLDRYRAERPRLAQQHLAGEFLGLGQCQRAAKRIVNLPAHQPGPAGATAPALAAVRQVEPRAQRAVEDALVGLDLELRA